MRHNLQWTLLPHLAATKDSKFGVIDHDFDEVVSVLLVEPRLRVVGLHCHLGSTIDDVSVYTKLFGLLEKTIHNYRDVLADVRIVNVGGGLGINYYHDQTKVTGIMYMTRSPSV